MDFNSSPFGKFIKSPLIRPIFTTDFDADGNPTPPLSDFRITDDSNFRITDSGNMRITDS